MPPVPIIRPATVGDAPNIAALIEDLSHYFLGGPATPEAEGFLASFAPEAIAAHVSDPSFRYLLAWVGNELAGVAALRDNRHIHHLFVAPAYHRHGIASQLWNGLKEEAIRSGNIEGFTVNSSLFAAPVYARWGFLPTMAPQTRNGVTYQPMRRPSIPSAAMPPFLAPSKYIDFHDPDVAALARTLAANTSSKNALIQRCFEFVRDEIKHSWDYKLNPVTCKASDVLRHGTGYCYAKSHLLAALLRANGISAGLCYQRLSVGDGGPPYCLHGLNAVFLRDHGWYRVDARGNKPGIAAQFNPPVESLAYPIKEAAERNLPEIWAEPLPAVIAILERYQDVAQVHAHLPDIELLPT